jgi:hypothetical protein
LFNKTYEIRNSDKVVNQLFDLCMDMQRKSEQGQDKQFAELVEKLSSLVNKLGQADIEQMILDLKELVCNS